MIVKWKPQIADQVCIVKENYWEYVGSFGALWEHYDMLTKFGYVL